MPHVADLLERALRQGLRRVPVPGQPQYWLYVSSEGDGLMASVLSGSTPLVTFGVARSEVGALHLWGLLRQHEDRAADRPPPTPWCGVVLRPGLALHHDAAAWLGDFERCMAWAWIEAAR